MLFFRFLFLPLSFIYSLGTTLRNRLYDLGVFSSYKPRIPSICIGNLRVGGTGKTPHIEYLLEKFVKDKNLITLSRGYGRKTKGFILADENTKVMELGDEPFQYLKKFRGKVRVTVGEDRREALVKIQNISPHVDTVLLDDGYQHRAVQCDLTILLTEYNKPFFNDYPYPAGLLREGRNGARRSDIVIVTKCPEGAPALPEVVEKIKKYAGEKPVFFTRYEYQSPVNIHSLSFPVPKNIIVLTGIANPDPFLTFLKKEHTIRKHFKFPDHYWYTENDVKEIVDTVLYHIPGTALVTTEKDFMRVDNPFFKKLLAKIPVFYYPVKVRFLEGEENFLNLIARVMQKKKDF